MFSVEDTGAVRFRIGFYSQLWLMTEFSDQEHISLSWNVLCWKDAIDRTRLHMFGNTSNVLGCPVILSCSDIVTNLDWHRHTTTSL